MYDFYANLFSLSQLKYGYGWACTSPFAAQHILKNTNYFACKGFMQTLAHGPFYIIPTFPSQSTRIDERRRWRSSFQLERMNFNNPFKFCNECIKPVFTEVGHSDILFVELCTSSRFDTTFKQSFSRMALQDINNPKVVGWTRSNLSYQRTLSWTVDSDKSVAMKRTFIL